MGMEDPKPMEWVQGTGTTTNESRYCLWLVVLAAVVGLGLMVDHAVKDLRDV